MLDVPEASLGGNCQRCSPSALKHPKNKDVTKSLSQKTHNYWCDQCDPIPSRVMQIWKQKRNHTNTLKISEVVLPGHQFAVNFHQQCGKSEGPLCFLFASIHQSCNTHSRNPIPWKHALVFFGSSGCRSHHVWEIFSPVESPVLMAKPY